MDIGGAVILTQEREDYLVEDFLELLRELTRLQHENGWLSDDVLRELAERRNVPLYRLEGLVSFYTHFRRTPPPRVAVQVCRDLSCHLAGGGGCLEALRSALDGREDVEIREVSCLGRCDAAPALAVDDRPLAPMTLSNQDAVIEAILNPVERRDRLPRERKVYRIDPYRSESEHFGTVRQWLAEGADVAGRAVGLLKQAGLRGMGGAGFPTATKWELVAGQSAVPKYVICNADESEPGTFKDREILDQLPHLVIEGMALAALCVGAEQGIIYLRHEYGREQEGVERALDRARAAGVLGKNILGTGRRFDIEIFVSPGGYILGEETALLEALEDKRGEPRNKPPYPGQHGLWGQPTLINNVETLALAAAICARGVEWWKAQGTRGFAGLKFFSVSGDVARPGVYEVPYGTTIRELLDLAGGVREGEPLKAILPGGASSNFLTPASLDVSLEFDAIKTAGSMLGSGAVVAIADGVDLFDLATNVVRFFRNESCGKCVPCRVGSQKAVGLLEDVQRGGRTASELSVLPELGETLTQTSICGLGQVALNPILSMMKQFPEDVPT